MNINDQDREEILRHWNRLGLFHRFLLLWIFPIFIKDSRCDIKAESLCYLATRLYGLPTKAVFVGEKVDETGLATLYWDSIKNYLKANLWSK